MKLPGEYPRPDLGHWGAFAPRAAVENGACDVRFSDGPEKGAAQGGFRGIEVLPTADLAIIYSRRIPVRPEEKKLIDEFAASGKPMIGLRTASHAFSVRGDAPAGFVNLAAELGIDNYGQIALETVALGEADILILNTTEGGSPSLAHEILNHPLIGRLGDRLRLVALPSRLWTCAGPAVIDGALVGAAWELVGAPVGDRVRFHGRPEGRRWPRVRRVARTPS